MTVKEAAALLGVKDSRIYSMIDRGLIEAERLEEPAFTGGPKRLRITSTEDQVREANANVKSRENVRTGKKINGSQGAYLTMHQLGRLLGISAAAARARVQSRGLRSRCIDVGGKLAIPRAAAQKLAKDGYLRKPKKMARKMVAAATPAAQAPSSLFRSVEEIQVKLSEIEEMLGRMLVAWGLK